ncbi:sortase domain-containing protein [Lacticaseibacillus saniviri]
MRIKSLIVAFLVGLGLAIGFSGERPVAAAESINGIATIQYQPGYGIALWSGISGRFTGRYLAHGSQWRVLAREQRDGQTWYQLGRDQWIDGQYANFQTRGQVQFLGLTTPVIAGDRQVTDAPAGNMGQTWGGATQLSVTDQLSTHIIGHDGPTNFNSVKRLQVGDAITVTDFSNQVRTYRVYKVASVNDQAIQMGTGINLFPNIVNADQGEQIVLQTCETETINRIVWAK